MSRIQRCLLSALIILLVPLSVWAAVSGDTVLFTGTDELAVSILRTLNTRVLPIRTHATDCTSLTDLVEKQVCFEEDDKTIYQCLTPAAGGNATLCDAPGEYDGPYGGSGTNPPVGPETSLLTKIGTTPTGTSNLIWDEDSLSGGAGGTWTAELFIQNGNPALDARTSVDCSEGFVRHIKTNTAPVCSKILTADTNFRANENVPFTICETVGADEICERTYIDTATTNVVKQRTVNGVALGDIELNPPSGGVIRIGSTIAPFGDNHIEFLTSGVGQVRVNSQPVRIGPITLPNAFADGTGADGGLIGEVTSVKPGGFKGATLRRLEEEAGGVWLSKVVDSAGSEVPFHVDIAAGLTKEILGNGVLIVRYTADTVTAAYEGTHNFTAAASLTVPNSAGAAPTTSARIAYDTTANRLKAGHNGSSKSLVTPDSADVLTNKTYNTESTGNVLETTVPKAYIAAGCNGSTAGPIWDLPTSTPAVAACVGTNVRKGVLQFADTAGGFSAQMTDILPVEFSTTGGFDVHLLWTTTATTGNAKWTIQVVCTAINAAATDDPAFPTSGNGFVTITTAAPGTASRVQTSSATAQTWPTSCVNATRQLIHWRVFRDGADAADTIAATAEMIGLEAIYRVSK